VSSPSPNGHLVQWRLWEGDQLVLEVQHQPATYFHTVLYERGGWPRHKVYRTFAYDPDARVIEAQLEEQGVEGR
jgi:hypothetical protein